jgi:aldehyde:ferredoxin oxidoreductase
MKRVGLVIEADVLQRLGGFHGRIAHVDLSAGRIWYDEHDPVWYRRYGGGGGLAAWYLLRDIRVGAEALGPENVIVFASSIIAGVDAPGVCRHAVLAKSPLSDATGETQSCSPFSAALKRSGLDALVVHGQASKPSYLVMAGGRVAVNDASSIWGMETADAHDWLVTAEGASAHTALIGPAGENRVRFASIVNDVNFMNSRTGMGAVMGSKRLKAVVAIEGPEVPFGDPEMANDAIDDYRRNRRTSLFNQLWEDAGSMNWVTAPPVGDDVEGASEREAMAGLPMPTRNWQKALFADVGTVANDVLEARYRIDEEPPRNLEHHRRYRVPSGEFATDPRYGGAETESLTGIAVFAELTEPEPVLKAIEMTYRFGLDPESLGGTIAWAMESVERGILDDADFDGISVAFGNGRAFLSLTEKIAHRQGVGNILAEGSARAAAHFGRGTERFAMVSRGIEMSGHDPRNKPGWALANASGPVGPDFMATEHDWDLAPAVEGSGLEDGIRRSRAYGIRERVAESEKGPKKVRLTIYLQRWWSGAIECLLFDYRAIAPMRYMPPARVEQLTRGVTGWDISIHEIMEMGERRVTMLQEFNRRHGLTQEDERFADRIHEEPIDQGPYAGAHLTLRELREMQSLYYAMHGWDSLGVPNDWRLHELDLGWIVDQRAELGRATDSASHATAGV